jgi:hypothetical protein
MTVNFDPNALLMSLLVGSVGFVLFVYGKRQARLPHMAVGAALCIYPYFVSNLVASIAIAVALVTLLWVAVRLGA